MTNALSLPELMQVRHLLAQAADLHLTELELRVCRFALRCAECGQVQPDDHLELIRKLLASVPHA